MRLIALSLRSASLALALPALAVLSASSAHAQLIITATFDSTWNTDVNKITDEAAINSLLASSYNANFTNPVNVAIVFSDVNTGLGSSGTGYYSKSYSSYLTHLTDTKSIAKGGDGNNAFLSNMPSSGNPAPATALPE